MLRQKLLENYIADNKIDFNITPHINTNIETETKYLPGPFY